MKTPLHRDNNLDLHTLRLQVYLLVIFFGLLPRLLHEFLQVLQHVVLNQPFPALEPHDGAADARVGLAVAVRVLERARRLPRRRDGQPDEIPLRAPREQEQLRQLVLLVREPLRRVALVEDPLRAGLRLD